MPGYPLVDAAGRPWEMGFQHGRAARSLVHTYLARILEDAAWATGKPRNEIVRAAGRLRPFLDRHCPNLLEEVAGLSEGAGLDPGEALLLQVRGEAVPALDAGCTSFVLGPEVTAEGEILAGQTSDMDGRMEDVGILLRLRPDEAPAMLMWTFAGQLGYHGLNSAGVAHFANAVAGGPAWRPGLPHYPLKRLLLEQRTLAECVALLERVPVCSSGNYVLAGGCGGIADAEVTPEGFALLEPGADGFLLHTNRFLHPRFRTRETDAAALPDSAPRLRRLRDLVLRHRGRVTVEHLKELLADHAGAPAGICRHAAAPGEAKTVAGLIAEPARGRLHVCRGNPCLGNWQTVTI